MIETKSDENKLMERVDRLFKIRQRSEKEIRDYFRIKNYELSIKGKEVYSDFAIENTIKKLREIGMINDEQFARAWAEARSRKYGVRRIRQELFQKGIDRETIEEVISSQSSVIREEQIAQILEKKIRIWKNLPEMELWKKATEYLMRRGFEYSVAKEAVEKFLQK